MKTETVFSCEIKRLIQILNREGIAALFLMQERHNVDELDFVYSVLVA